MGAACYVRSSKDRNDVSLSAQLRELTKLASSRNLEIVRTYEDAVQSGSTEDRPAFRELIADIKSSSRGWSTLLVYDTSRIARGRYIAQAFRHECRRRGVELVIARMPETDPISAVILEAVLEAMDEVHSIMSREKGLAGMRENVRLGWRAGGRAPFGYRLQHEPTGAVRDGRPVMKSKLVLTDQAPAAAKYLNYRAAGISRVEAARRANIDLAPTTLIGIEWNASVYAGHTIWNRHNAKKDRGSGKSKRRDRSEWVVQRGTHEALITDAQAEAIIAQLETSTIGRAVSLAKASGSDYLLAGVLQTKDGQLWVGAGKHYRLKPAGGQRGKRIPREEIERAVMATVRTDMKSDKVVAALVTKAKKHLNKEDRVAPVHLEIESLGKKRQRAATLALGEGGEIYARMAGDLGRQIEALKREADALAAESRADNAVQAITPTEIRELLMKQDNDRALLKVFVRRVVLDADLQGRVEYGLSMASPRGFDRWAAGPVTVLRRIA
jgi:site-specific DNA recombinase